MEHSRTGDGTIKSVGTGMDILELLREGGGRTVSEIAEELAVSNSTAHRYLKTLYEREYVVKESGMYKIGLRFMQHGLQAKNRYDGIDMIQRKVHELADETGERSQFMTAEHGKTVCLCHSMGRRAVQLKMEIGERVPLHAISLGKTILAERSDEEIEQYIENYQLTALTEHTITDSEELWAEIEATRERGYGTNKHEYVDQIHAAAVPVYRPDDSLHGALGVAGPHHRMDQDRLETEIVELLQGTATEIKLNLEYNG